MNFAPVSLVDELIELQFASGHSAGESSVWIAEELASISQFVEFPAGTVIFEQGAPNSKLYLIRGGRVGLDMPIPAKGTVRILTLSRGELLAWSSVVGDGEMTVAATALESVHVIAIDGPQLMSLCNRRHDVGFHVLQRISAALAHRLTATRLQLLDLYTHQTPQVLRPQQGGG